MRKRALAAGLAAMLGGGVAAREAAEDRVPDVRLFFEAAARDDSQARAALDAIAGAWRDAYAALILDLARFFPPVRRPTASGDVPEVAPDSDAPGRIDRGFEPAFPPATGFDPGSLVRQRLTRFLEKQTGRRHGDDLRAWRRWLWSRPYEPHPGYLLFKAMLYQEIDPRMAGFFPPGARALIRLDEIDWGGVMFEVPRTDPRLKNKDEVLGLLLRPAGVGSDAPRRAIALSADFLARHPLHRLSFAGRDLVAVTSRDGANRVYETGGVHFTRVLAGAVEDAAGGRWRVTEDALVHEATGEQRERVPAHRAFWFGWYAQFPETELVE